MVFDCALLCVLLLKLPDPVAPIVRGTLDGPNAYVSGVDRVRGNYHGVTGVGGSLSNLRRDIRGEEKLEVLDHHRGGAISLLRWQLVGKRYFCVRARIGADEPLRLRSALLSDPLEYLEAANAGGNYAERQKALRRFDGTADGLALGAVLGETYWSKSYWKGGREAANGVYFDIWARGRHLYEVYVGQAHLNNRLTRENFHPERVNGTPEEKKRAWERVGEWKFDFTGPFYVAVSGEERFIVTDNGGRIFLAPRGAPRGTPLKEIWKGPRVDALIHDSDSTKWYAFTKDQWFEITTEIKPKPHTITVRRAWTAEAALETVMKCGRVIRGLPEPNAK